MKYRLIFRGGITAGANIEEVKKGLAALLKADSPKINSLFSGKPVIIKKDSDLKTCQKIKAVFEQAGAVSFIEPHKPTETTDAQTDHSKVPIPQPPPLPERKKTKPPEIAKSGHTRRGDEKFCVSCGAVIKLNSLACLEDLEFEPSQTQISVLIIDTDESCFVAKATHIKLRHELWADCNGVTDKKTRKLPE